MGASDTYKGPLHDIITHALNITEPIVQLQDQTYLHKIGNFLKTGNTAESGLAQLSQASMNFGIDSGNALTTARFNWYTNVAASDDLSTKTPIMTLTEDGVIGLGVTLPGVINNYSKLDIQGDAHNILADVHAFSNAAADCAGIMLGRGRGTRAAKTTVAALDRLGFIVGQGYDGTNWHNPAAIIMKVDDTVAAGSVHTQIRLETGVTGATRAARLIIMSGGKVGLGIETPSGIFDIGLATLGRAISWGGTAANYINIWGAYTEGDLVLATGLRGGTGADTYLSSYGGASVGRAAIRLLLSNGSIKFFSDAASTTADGTAITPTLQMIITNDGKVTVTGGFGCNGQAAQTAYASGGALAAYGTGAFGFDTEAHASALHAMVVSIRAALVANGVMS